jgi:hypothetical protein
MDPKEEGILLGELKSFRQEANSRLDTLEQEVKALGNFKVKILAIGSTIFALLELGSRVLQHLK